MKLELRFAPDITGKSFVSMSSSSTSFKILVKTSVTIVHVEYIRNRREISYNNPSLLEVCPPDASTCEMTKKKNELLYLGRSISIQLKKNANTRFSHLVDIKLIIQNLFADYALLLCLLCNNTGSY